MNTDAHQRQRIGDAIEKCDWSYCPIGNKELLRAAIIALKLGDPQKVIVNFRIP